MRRGDLRYPTSREKPARCGAPGGGGGARAKTSVLGGELEHRDLVVGFSRLERTGGEVGVIGGVGKMLGLKTEAGAEAVNVAAFAVRGSVQKVAGVELDTGLGCLDGQDATAGRFLNARCLMHYAHLSVEDVVVVVALPQAQLFVVILDSRADGRCLAKIQRGS